MRRFAKTTVSNLGYADFSEWMLGHSGSTYYDSPVSDLIAIWRKVEPYLTFLDVTAMEAKQQDMQTQLDDTKEQLQKAKEEFQQAAYDAYNADEDKENFTGTNNANEDRNSRT